MTHKQALEYLIEPSRIWRMENAKNERKLVNPLYSVAPHKASRNRHEVPYLSVANKCLDATAAPRDL